MKEKKANAILQPGQRLAKYTIKRKLANGGFGVVYLASRSDGHQVAIKEFLPSIIECRDYGTKISCKSEYDRLRFEEGLKSFFREADTLAKVHNPRIIPIWDVFKENGTAYFAMPVEKGGTLQSLIKLKKEKLNENELREIFVEACKGVEAIHEMGVLHLDIKPSNLWIRPDKSVLVLDLGASRWEDEEVKLSQMARTPGFAAPEQHSNLYAERGKNTKSIKVKLGYQTDIYGLCASFLACLLNTPPLPANKRGVGEIPISWSQIGQCSSELLKVLGKGMSLQPNFRQSSVRQLRKDLESIPRLFTAPRWKEKLDNINIDFSKIIN